MNVLSYLASYSTFKNGLCNERSLSSVQICPRYKWCRNKTLLNSFHFCCDESILLMILYLLEGFFFASPVRSVFDPNSITMISIWLTNYNHTRMVCERNSCALWKRLICSEGTYCCPQCVNNLSPPFFCRKQAIWVSYKVLADMALRSASLALLWPVIWTSVPPAP